MGDESMNSSPTLRASTRNVQRINYAELNSSGVDDPLAARSSSADDGNFRTPYATTRGRKRKPIDELASGVSGVAITTGQSKRGRPRGAISGPGRGRGRGRIAAAGEKGHDSDEGTLFGAVKANKNIDEMLDEWIEEYSNNYSTALSKLLQFFFSSTGCKGKVPTHIINNIDYPTLIKQMTENFGEDTADYPLLQSGSYRRYRANLHIFLNALIMKCKSSVIFDNRMMDMIVQLLTGLADSSVRAFRHTATFCAMKICSALVDVALELARNSDTNAKQLEAEKAKIKQAGGATDKLDFLMQQKDEMESHMEDVRHMLTYLFKSVFVHRYRDILADARSICIAELGYWIEIYPEHFLEDSYLKYIGWTLYDKVPEVRICCIKALLPLYNKPENLGKLELFTNKFKERLVSMVLDTDMDTAVQACHLMSSIYRVFPTLLQAKDCLPIYDMVYSNHRPLAVAAGEFLNTKVFQQIRAANKGQSNNIQLIMDLISFYDEGDCHDHATYLVDALIDTNEMIKDWKTMVELLLAKDSFDESRKEGLLIDILCCSVKQAATGEYPAGRYQVKRGAPLQKEAKSITDDRERLSGILIPALPKLLEKFIGDREKVAQLATLPQYFVLDMYMAGRMENYLTDLWTMLQEIVNKHVDDDCLTDVAETVSYLLTNQTVATHLERYKTALLDALVSTMRRVIQSYPSDGVDMEDEAALEESRADVDAIFRRVAAFACVIDMKRYDVADQAALFLQNHDRLSDAVTEKAILIIHIQMLYDLLRITKDQESNRTDAIKKLKKKRENFVQTAGNVIKFGSAGVTMVDRIFIVLEVKQSYVQSFLTMCDMCTFFNSSLVSDDSEKSKQLQPLVYKLDDSILRSMADYVERCVFKRVTSDSAEPYHQVELNHKKRIILAGFAKLAIHDCINPEEAAFMLKYYQDVSA
ncbi:hypothetical protein WR25_07075 isoform A [Diploscapter pachys]|uniref:SCD domain-containing protein n=1 Tax=Diploscapter pachys TaxID=2018661 RepID=A0A2A2LMU5_9BILA|nr:hypothetical protein WR25_07075 isoform A [Diploscapter pachys]